MPGLSNAWVAKCLAKLVPKSAVCTKVHFAEEELSGQTGGRMTNSFALLPGLVYNILCDPVKFSTVQAAEMEVRKEQGRCRRLKVGRTCFWLFEGGDIRSIIDNKLK